MDSKAETLLNGKNLVFLATTMGDVEHAKQWIKEGYTMMNIGSSLQYGTIGLSKIFEDIRDEYGVDWH